MRSLFSNAAHFAWGVGEGIAYHGLNIAQASFGMRDLSSMDTYRPSSLISNQERLVPENWIEHAEQIGLPMTYEARRMDPQTDYGTLLRARGRAMGEQIITIKGLLSLGRAGAASLNNLSGKLPNQSPLKDLSREYLYSGKVKANELLKAGRGKNHQKLNLEAEGVHSTFRRDPATGKVSHYATYQPQTNRFNPKEWELLKRFDSYGKSHLNKNLNIRIETPHIHDPLQWRLGTHLRYNYPNHCRFSMAA